MTSTLHVLMTRPSKDLIRGIVVDGGNGAGVCRAHQNATSQFGLPRRPVILHGFAASDFLATFRAEALMLGVSCELTETPGTTRMNEAVPRMSRKEDTIRRRLDDYLVQVRHFEQMKANLLRQLQPGDTLVISGSRPHWDLEGDPGPYLDWEAVTYALYVELIAEAQALGVYVALDVPHTDDTVADAPIGPLEMVFATAVRPDMTKHNRREWDALEKQLLENDPDFAAMLATVPDENQRRLLIAERLMPKGLVVISFGKQIFAKDESGNAWLFTLQMSAKFAGRWLTSVGRGDTVMGFLMAGLRLVAERGKSLRKVIKGALAARAAQTFHEAPGHFATQDAADLRFDVTTETIAKVEQEQPVGSPV